MVNFIKILKGLSIVQEITHFYILVMEKKLISKLKSIKSHNQVQLTITHPPKTPSMAATLLPIQKEVLEIGGKLNLNNHITSQKSEFKTEIRMATEIDLLKQRSWYQEY